VAGTLGLEQFDESGQSVIRWTRGELSRQARRFLVDLPLAIEGPGFACAHAEFECPQRFDYLANPATVWGSLEAASQSLLFAGHARLPGVQELRPNGSMKHLGAVDFTPRSGCRYLVDVGSVGDPRDGNPRASYCVFDTDSYAIQYRRVAFDVDAWEREIRGAELAVSPYVLGGLKYGEQGGGELPADFTPVEVSSKAPLPLDVNEPRPYEAIQFDPTLEAPAPKAVAKSATRSRKRRRSTSAKSVAGVSKGAASVHVEAAVPVVSGNSAKNKKLIIIASVVAVIALGLIAASLSGGGASPVPPVKVVERLVAKPGAQPKPKAVAREKPAPKAPARPKSESKPKPAPKVGAAVVPENGLLHARLAVIHGPGAIYEQREDRLCVGNWSSSKAWVSWTATIKKGRYKVSVVQARLKPAQYKYQVRIANHTFDGQVQETGGWDKFVEVDLGEFVMEGTGDYQVVFRLLSKKGTSFLNRRGIQLDPMR
ncbi:MAG: hypothetical protein ACI8W8_004618, partial [Rhodothermales bacterium]